MKRSRWMAFLLSAVFCLPLCVVLPGCSDSGGDDNGGGGGDPPPVTTGARYALVVGLDNYRSGQDPLNSCINDANGMANAFLAGSDRTAGVRWNSANITRLMDAAGTKSAILGAIQSMAQRANANDLVVIYHSGHGTQISGTEAALVPYDYNRANGRLTDSEFAAALNAFRPGVNVVCIIDTCHAAGMFKDGTPHAVRFALGVNRRLDEIARAAGAPKATDRIAWMASSDYHQLSAAGRPYSLYTRFLLEAFVSGDANRDGRLSFMELHAYAEPRTRAQNAQQSPQSLNDNLLASLVAANRLSSPPGHDGGPPPPGLPPATTINGRLETSDGASRTRAGCFADFHTLNGTGGAFQIDLMSTAFDAYLHVYDGSGALVAVDDDGGDGTNARLRIQTRSGVRYTIEATSYGRAETGAYTLRIQPL